MTIIPEEMQQQEIDAMFLSVFAESFAVEATLLTLWMCSECGAMVRNTDSHYLWHKKLEGLDESE